MFMCMMFTVKVNVLLNIQVKEPLTWFRHLKQERRGVYNIQWQLCLQSMNHLYGVIAVMFFVELLETPLTIARDFGFSSNVAHAMLSVRRAK